MRTIAEKPETLRGQVKALRSGTNPVVYVPKGTKGVPDAPKGCKKVRVNGDSDGAGTYIFRGVEASEVREAAKSGRHGELLGYVQTKSEVAQGLPLALVARDKKGTELKAAAVDARNLDAVDRQAEVLRNQFPGATVRAEDLRKVVIVRLS